VPRTPGVRAAAVAMLALIGGALVNLATSGIDLSGQRWWIVGGVVLIGAIGSVLEYRHATALLSIPSNAAPDDKGEEHWSSDVPWMIPSPAGSLVDRPEIVEVEQALLTNWPEGESPSSTEACLIVAVYGTGGYGKTTLVSMVGHRPATRAEYQGGSLWVHIGEGRSEAAIVGIINDMCGHLTGSRGEYSDALQAGLHLGALLDLRPRTLIVIDDVWHVDQLRPFLVGGATATRLVTTRIPGLLPDHAKLVRLDEMSVADSRKALTANLTVLPESVVDSLLNFTGRWPLLLGIANRSLVQASRAGADPVAAAKTLIRRLNADGPAGLDRSVESSRERAVSLSVAASLDWLKPEWRPRYLELGVFAGDSAIPRDALVDLWVGAGELREGDVDQLCAALADLSLVLEYRHDTGSLRLHDVLRSYVRHETDRRLVRLNRALIAATRRRFGIKGRAWWTMPHTGQGASYWWNQVAYHLREARQQLELARLVCDPRWVQAKTRLFGALAVMDDLQSVDTPIATKLRRVLLRDANLLAPTEPEHSHVDIIVDRIQNEPALRGIVDALIAQLPRDELRLVRRWPLDDISPALARVLHGHKGPVVDLAIAPDESWLATVGDDGAIRLWNLSNDDCLEIAAEPDEKPRSVEIGPDGSWLLTMNFGAKIHQWNSSTGAKQTTIQVTERYISGMALMPNGSEVAVGVGGSIEIRDISSASIKAVLPDTDVTYDVLVCSPDGSWLAAAGEQRTVEIDKQGLIGKRRAQYLGWSSSPGVTRYDTNLFALTLHDVASGARRATLLAHTDWINACAIAPDGSWLATASSDSTIGVWDVSTGTERATLLGHSGNVYAVAIAPNSRWMASGGEDCAVRLWDTSTGEQRATLVGHTDLVKRIAIAPSGRWLASAGYDGTVRVWESTFAGTSSPSDDTDSVSDVVAIGVDLIATTHGDNTVRLRDAQTGVVQTVLIGHSEGVMEGFSIYGVSAVATSSDPTWLATAGYDGVIRLWETASGAELANIKIWRVNMWPAGLAISPDGAWLAFGRCGAPGLAPDGSIHILHIQTGMETMTLKGHSHWVSGIAIAPNGSWLASSSEDQTVRLWDANTGREKCVVQGHTGKVNCVAISPDGSWLASASDDWTARLWDAETGLARSVLQGHGGPVTCVTFAPGGSLVATTSTDQTLRIWESQTGRPAATMRIDGPLRSVAWTAEGDALVVAGARRVYCFELIQKPRES